MLRAKWSCLHLQIALATLKLLFFLFYCFFPQQRNDSWAPLTTAPVAPGCLGACSRPVNSWSYSGGGGGYVHLYRQGVNCWSRLGCLLLYSPGATLPSHASPWSPPLCNRTNNSKWTQLVNDWEAEICFPWSVCQIVMNMEEVCLKKEPCFNQTPNGEDWISTVICHKWLEFCEPLTQMGVTPFQSKQSSPALWLPGWKNAVCLLWVFAPTSKYACFVCSQPSSLRELRTLSQAFLLWIPTASKIKPRYLQMG